MRSNIVIDINQKEIDDLLKYFPDGIVAFDLETTGLSPLLDKIIEISAIKIGPQIETFHTLIDPKTPIPELTSKIHGLYDKDVKGAPELNEGLQGFFNFVGKIPLLAHNAQFDAGFLINSLELIEMPFPPNKIYCSVKFARKVFPKKESYSLGELSQNLGITLSSHHHAMDDAYACLKIFLKGLFEPKMSKSILKDFFLFSLKDFKSVDPNLESQTGQEIIQAIKEQRHIEIMYRGGSYKGKFRPIRPLSILPLPQGPAVYAHCMLTDLYKFFYLSKITETRNSDEL
ncbi:MAG: exonuclease domain-containing protein [Bacteriovoracaceae bacterium]